jgi:hypothetical protein
MSAMPRVPGPVREEEDLAPVAPQVGLAVLEGAVGAGHQLGRPVRAVLPPG